jgi:uncharacterized protein
MRAPATHDFWCCHGTLVQAQAMHEDLIDQRTAGAVVVSQFIPSRLAFGEAGRQVRITQRTDAARDTSDFSREDGVTHFVTELTISADRAERWMLRIRQPAWVAGPVAVTVDDVPVPATVSKDGYVEIDREWKDARVRISFPKGIVSEPLPGDGQRFALLGGPVVLAALTAMEPELAADAAITPHYEHQYVEGRDWLAGHFWARTRHGLVALKPLYEIADEPYRVYFAHDPGSR